MRVLFHGIGGYGEGEPIGRACWPHHDVILVLAGTLHFRVGELRLSCAAGDAVHVAPNTPFSGISGALGCRLWVQHFAVAAADYEQFPALRDSGCFSQRVEGDWLKPLRLRIEAAHREENVRALQHLLFLFLLDLGAVHPQVPNEYRDGNTLKLLALRDGLKTEPHPLPTVDALAEGLGWSRAYFTARFRECCGVGPGTYLRSLRLEQAGRLLRETRLPIKIISERLGYSDPVAFHRAFRQGYGLTPKSWRNGAPRVI